MFSAILAWIQGLIFLAFAPLAVFFFSSRRRHTRCSRDWSSDVCSSDLRTMFGILHGVCCCVKGAGGVPVDSNMVGMPVGPTFVERHHYLGAELTDDCYKFPYYLCRVGLGKCTRVPVFGCTCHTGITVTQKP